MGKIPRSEQSVDFRPAMQPFSSGDGYEAPGRGLQRIGQGISSVGQGIASLQGVFDKDDEFKAKLAMLKLSNEQDLDDMQSRSSFNPDKDDVDGYSAGRMTRFQERANEALSGIQSQRARQMAMLHVERMRGSVGERAQSFQLGQKQQQLYNGAERAITGEFGKLNGFTPTTPSPDAENQAGYAGAGSPAATVAPEEQYMQRYEQTLRAAEMIIQDMPATTDHKQRLAKHVASMAVAALGNRKDAWPAVEKWLEGQRAGMEQTRSQGQPGSPATANRSGSAVDFLRTKLAPGYEKRQSDVDNLRPEKQDRLAAFLAAAEDAGHDIRIVSGHRDSARQAVLWRNALAKYGSADEARKHVAPPGGSTHQSGEAVDLQYQDRGAGLGGKRTAAVDWAHKNAAKFGLHFPLGHEDWHLEPVEARAGGRRYGGEYASGKQMWKPSAGGQQQAVGQTESSPDLTARVSPQEFFRGKVADVTSLPLGMRVSNNPTNIKFSGSAFQRQNFPGLVGPSEAKDQGDPQAQFANPLAGMVAGVKLALLKNKEQGLNTVSAIITDKSRGWTPGYQGAAEAVAKTMGVGVNDRIDLSNPDTMKKFMRALITQEHGPSGRLYDDALVSRGVDIGLGRQTAPTAQSAQSTPVAQRGLVQYAGLPPSGRTANDASPPSAMPLASSPAQGAAAAAGREANTIPSAQPVQVAQAAAPLSPVRAELVESLLKAAPAMQSAYKQQVEGMVSNIEAMAARGYEVGDDAIGKVSAQVARTRDPLLQQRMDMMSSIVRESRATNAASPGELTNIIQRLEAQAMKGPVTPQQVAAIEHFKKKRTETEKALASNPYEHGTRVGLLPGPVPEIRPDMPPQALAETLQARVIARANMEDRMQTPVPLLQGREQQELIEYMTKAGAPPEHRLAVLRTMYDALGSRMIKDVKEVFGKDAPDLAMIGWLMANNADPMAMKDAVRGIDLRKSDGFVSRVPGDKDTARTASDTLIGTAFAGMPGADGYAIEVAKLIYEARAHDKQLDPKLKIVDPTLWAESLNEALGRNKVADVSYGGMGSVSAGWSSAKVFVIPSVRSQGGLQEIMSKLRTSDFLPLSPAKGSAAAAGREDDGQSVAVPGDARGRPVPIAIVRSAVPVWAGGSTYFLRTGTDARGQPEFLKLAGAPDINFRLDVEALRPAMLPRVTKGTYRPTDTPNSVVNPIDRYRGEVAPRPGDDVRPGTLSIRRFVKPGGDQPAGAEDGKAN